MTIVELTGISKRFGAVQALAQVEFAVARGSCVALLGPSGCGKTSTLRLIAGFDDPDTGTIRLAGRDVVGKRPYERNVGLVFQDYALFPHMSVEDNIAYGMRHRGIAKAEIPERVRARLAQVKMSGYERRRPSQLSGGEQQRVALARALATEPEVLLLDEPLSNLDAKLRQELRGELRALLATVGTTTIIVTHDQEEAIALADRIVVMNRGRVEQIGTPEEIYAQPRTRFVAEFMGRSNWFTGTLGADGASFRSDAGEAFAVRPGAALPGRVEVAVRPERIRMTPPASADRLDATVESTEYLGHELHVWLRLAGGTRVLAIEKNIGQPRLAAGDVVGIELPPEGCIVLAAS